MYTFSRDVILCMATTVILILYEAPFFKAKFHKRLHAKPLHNLCTMYTVVEVYYCIHVGSFDMGLGYVGIQRSSYGGWLSRVLSGMIYYLHKYYSGCVLRYASRYI